MELIGEYLGFHTDKDICNYFDQHWKSWFPDLPDRNNFIRQCANLWDVKQRFFEHISRFQDHYVQILDSMPVEVCKSVRGKRTTQFKKSRAYGKWFGQTFFGYRLHLKITDMGIIRGFISAPANERDVRYVEALLVGDQGGWVLAIRAIALNHSSKSFGMTERRTCKHRSGELTEKIRRCLSKRFANWRVYDG
jgi:hypothetical protein